MNLDELYGPCKPPVRAIEDQEHRLNPMSMMILDQSNCAHLKMYLDTKAHFNLTTLFAQTYPILWLIDQSARILLAVEEVLDDNNIPIGALPRSKLARPVQYLRLGHPSLLNNPQKAARIGGEIRFDPDFEPEFHWILTNESGRYGSRSWQTEDHLVQARRLFARFGLKFAHYFIPPRPDQGDKQ